MHKNAIKKRGLSQSPPCNKNQICKKGKISLESKNTRSDFGGYFCGLQAKWAQIE